MALDEPQENDAINTINDIKVAFDPMIGQAAESLTLDCQENNGKSELVITGNESDCC